jgi:hypothetical protein
MHPASRFAALIAVAVVPSLSAQAHDHGTGRSAEQLGRVTFPVSCSAEAAKRFERAMAALHSFWWEQGQAAFQSVVAADSTCAMGYWGQALNAWGNPFTGGPGGIAGKGARLQRGAAWAQRAFALGQRNATPRERGFLAAGAALYGGSDSIPNIRRLQAYSDTLARAYRDFPNDTEVAIYYALSLVATAAKTDTTFARQKKAAAILNPLFQRYPEHPGLAHYIIHANDSPRLAVLGLDAARRYAEIAPSAPHAQHMPSHIFIRRGMWDETIVTNQRSFDAGMNYARAQGTPVAPEQFHALDYMVYAYLQQGRDSAARGVINLSQGLTSALNNDVLLANYNRVAMELRLALERGAWAEAARLPIRAGGMTIGKALAHFARGIGAVRTGDTAAARSEVASLADIEADMVRRGDTEWSHVVGIKKRIVTSWVAYARGDTAFALREAQQAADIEDVTEKHPVTPGELLPARELYADMLLAVGRNAEARAAYEATLTREPRRARSLFGAGRYAEFLSQMKPADGDRPEIAQARQNLR